MNSRRNAVPRDASQTHDSLSSRARRELAGHLVWRDRKSVLRIPIGTKRPFRRLRCDTEQEANARAALTTDMVMALRATEKADLTEELVKRAAAARSTAELEGVRMAV